MRQVLLGVVFVVILVLCRLAFSQGAPEAVEAAPEVQLPTVEEPLKGYQPPNRMKPEAAANFVAAIIYGTFAIVIIMFLLLAFFHEPSHASKPYSPTKVVRAEGFVSKPREREQHSERISLDDE